MGLKGRVHLEWISSAEAQKFAQVVTDFTEKIRTLGPNPLTRFVVGQPAADPDLIRQWETMQSNVGKIAGLNTDLDRLDKGEFNAGYGKKVA